MSQLQMVNYVDLFYTMKNPLVFVPTEVRNFSPNEKHIFLPFAFLNDKKLQKKVADILTNYQGIEIIKIFIMRDGFDDELSYLSPYSEGVLFEIVVQFDVAKYDALFSALAFNVTDNTLPLAKEYSNLYLYPNKEEITAQKFPKQLAYFQSLLIGNFLAF